MALTEEQLNQISNETRRAVNKALWRHTRSSLAGFAVLVLAVAWGFHENSAIEHKDFVRSQKARGVLCQIIKRGDSQAYLYKKEGTITAVQLHRALVQSAIDRKLLGPGPGCDTALTPPPTNLNQPGPSATPSPHQLPNIRKRQ